MCALALKEMHEVAQHLEPVLGIDKGNGTDCKDYSGKEDAMANRTPTSPRAATELRCLQALDPNTIDGEPVRTGDGQKQTGEKWKRKVRQVGEGTEKGSMLSTDTLNSGGLKRRWQMLPPEIDPQPVLLPEKRQKGLNKENETDNMQVEEASLEWPQYYQ